MQCSCLGSLGISQGSCLSMEGWWCTGNLPIIHFVTWKQIVLKSTAPVVSQMLISREYKIWNCSHSWCRANGYHRGNFCVGISTETAGTMAPTPAITVWLARSPCCHCRRADRFKQCRFFEDASRSFTTGNFKDDAVPGRWTSFKDNAYRKLLNIIYIYIIYV